jgi:hypothetical protein
MTETPKPLRLHLDPEAARAANVRAVEMMTALRESMKPFAVAYLATARRVLEALRPLAEWAEQHPELMEQWQREREAEQQLGSCHCLCGAHREKAVGVCKGVAAPGLTVRFDSPTVGVQDVAMCAPCYNARQLVPSG